jgi:hypothetical protein
MIALLFAATAKLGVSARVQPSAIDRVSHFGLHQFADFYGCLP